MKRPSAGSIPQYVFIYTRTIRAVNLKLLDWFYPYQGFNLWNIAERYSRRVFVEVEVPELVAGAAWRRPALAGVC